MFRYQTQKIWTGLLVFFFLITACAPLTAIPKVEPTISVTPPPATQEINGVTQTAGLGSYCWSNKEVSTCADIAGISTALDPLVLTEFPATAQFHFETELAPDNMTMSVMPVTQRQEFLSADNAHRLWNPGQGWSVSLSSKVSFEYPFQEMEFANGDGLYVILISAHWKDLGDIQYGFLVQIGTSNQQVGVTPAASIPTPQLVSLQTVTPVTRLGKGTATSLALSADGKWLAVNTPMGVYVYETKTQNEIWFLPTNNQRRVLDFSPDGERLAIGAQNGGVLVVRSDTGEALYHIATEQYGQPKWSPDETKLLTGASCGEVHVWDADSGALLHTVQKAKCGEGPYSVRAIWSSDGKRIYVNNNTGYVQVWDATTYQPLTGYQPHPPEYSYGLEIVSSPTQNLFALLNGLSIAIMDGESREVVKMLEGNNRRDIRLEGIVWSPDGKKLASGNGSEIIVWDVDTGRQIHNISGYQPISGLSWMPDGETLVGLLSPEGSLNAVKLNGETVFSLYGFGSAMGYSSTSLWDGPQLLTYDGMIIHWEALTGKILEKEQVSSRPAWASSGLSPDETRIAYPETVKDSKNFKEIVHLIDNSEHGRDKVAWSPDGTRLASGDSLNIAPIVVWDAQTGKRILTFPTGDIPLYLGALAFSRDGNLLAAGGSLMDSANGLDEGVLILWNANSGERAHVLTAGMSSQRVMSIAWSPDGHWLAAGTYSGRIILWDMLTLQPVAFLDGHADQVFGFSWSEDSTLLASSSSDGTVLIWKIP